MKFILYLLLLCIPFELLAQEKSKDNTEAIQTKIVKSAINSSITSSSIAPVNELLDSKEITITKLEADLYLYKAHFLEGTYYSELHNRSSDSLSFQLKTKEILSYYDLAIEKSDCWKIEVQYKKYNFLHNLVGTYRENLNPNLKTLYHSLLEDLKTKGLKPERDGYGMGVYFILGQEKWIGLDFSVFSYFRAVSKFKTKCNNEPFTYSPRGNSIQAVNALTLSYSRSFESKTNDLSFSLIEFYSPLVFIPARFGVQLNSQSKKKNFYYRPGIGMSFGPLSVSYSYNLIFKKTERSTSENHIIYIKLNYPITNHKYKTK
jgi:hypothetical protein